MKTEHAGAKNGGGAWTTRAIAKTTSNKARRAAGRRLVRYDSPFASTVWCTPEQSDAFQRQDAAAVRMLADLR